MRTQTFLAIESTFFNLRNRPSGLQQCSGIHSYFIFCFSGFGIKAKLIKKFISQNDINPHLIDAEHIKGVD